MHRGYVRLWRCSKDSAVWQSDRLWRLWCHLLIDANYKDGWGNMPGVVEPVLVKRGQLLTGRNSLHKALYDKSKKGCPTVSAKTVWRDLRTLETLQNVSLKVSNRFTIVTVCNYNTYNPLQADGVHVSVPEVSRRCPAGVPLVSTSKERKELKEESTEELRENDSLALPPFWGLLLDTFESTELRTKLGVWFHDLAQHPLYTKTFPDFDLALSSTPNLAQTNLQSLSGRKEQLRDTKWKS